MSTAQACYLRRQSSCFLPGAMDLQASARSRALSTFVKREIAEVLETTLGATGRQEGGSQSLVSKKRDAAKASS